MALLGISRRRSLTVAVPVIALVLSALAPTSAGVIKRPDLTVTKGSIRVSDAQAKRLDGGFTVRNAGNLPASDSKALVQAKVGKRWKKLTELQILPLAPKKNAAYAFHARRPEFIQLGGGKYPIRVCLDVNDKVRESREGNNCHALGTLRFELVEDEVDYQPDKKFFHSYFGVGYYGWVPSGYDDSGNTPTTVFIWLHGCGGMSKFDIDAFHAKSEESFITLAPVGREGDCWRTPPNNQIGDEQLISDVLDDASEHFNLDLDNIVLGGYSSGGDLAYRTGYLFSSSIAAVLVANSSPLQDTGITEDKLATVERKFRVVHLAHLSDEEYPIANVRSELQKLATAGFPVTGVERAGNHYDDPGPGVPGTDADIQEVLLPQVDPVA